MAFILISEQIPLLTDWILTNVPFHLLIYLRLIMAVIINSIIYVYIT